jgi:nicotinate (nicotinamide) nucleotide adenylyltransferase
MKFIGLHVGSFDPIHHGHSDLCNQAFSRGITDIIVIPAFDHPGKKNWAPFDKRMEMCNLHFIDDERIFVSDIEKRIAKENEKTYTVNTVISLKEELKRTLKNDFQIRLLIGDDLLPKIGKWKNAPQLFELAPVMVLKRGEISSTAIRRGFISDDIKLGWLKSEVFEYILKNKLYGAKEPVE